MAISLISSKPLAGNAALFENNAASGQDLGDITWGAVTEEGGTYYVTIQGTDAQGNSIPATETTTTSSGNTVNPTKVFFWVARTLKAVLCPECV